MEKIKTKWRVFKKSDFTQWEEEAKSSFTEEDFCDAAWLNENWAFLKGWVLVNATNNEWIGVAFLSFHPLCNEGGLAENHFRECWVSEKYRGFGFSQSLYNKIFDEVGCDKEITLCVSPANFISKKTVVKNNFKKIGFYKCWELYKYFPLAESC